MEKVKILLFFITLLSYCSLNYLNITNSFLKRFIQTQFNLNPQELALTDSFKFFGSAIGLFTYIILQIGQKKKIIVFYIVSLNLNALLMGIIPFCSYLEYQQKWVVFVAQFLGGLSRAPSWSLLLQYAKDNIFYLNGTKQCNKIQIQNQQQNQKSQKKRNEQLFMIWTALTSFGNIFGLLIGQLFIYKLKVSWLVCSLVPVIFIFVSSILLFFVDMQQKQNGQNCQKGNNCTISQQSSIENSISFNSKNLIRQCFWMLFLTKNCTFTWSLIILLSIHSILMMYLPLYLFQIGYQQYQGYILAVYNITTVIGSYAYAYISCQSLYQYVFSVPMNQAEIVVIQKSPKQDDQNDIRIGINRRNARCFPTYSQSLNISSMILSLVVCVVIICLPCPLSCGDNMLPQGMNNSHNKYNLLWYFILIGLFGLFIGGPLNNLQSTQFILVLNRYQRAIQKKSFKNPSPKICCYKQAEQRKNIQKVDIQQNKLSHKKTSRTFIGMVQLISYLSVMMFLILTGRIIGNNILQFFYLVSILVSFVFILTIIKTCQQILSVQNGQQMQQIIQQI